MTVVLSLHNSTGITNKQGCLLIKKYRSKVTLLISVVFCPCTIIVMMI